MSVRDRLRPTYQRLGKFVHDCRHTVAKSSIWPKPAAWHDSKRQMADVTDSAQLYKIAIAEFGILQVENEIVSFLDFLAGYKPKVIGEIGLKHGGNSFMFLRKLQHAEVYLGMDLVLENIAKLKFYRRHSQQIHTLEGNSQLPAIVKKARKRLSGRQFDFLFIDGDHEYAAVLEDFIQWYPLVRSGGLIAFHDIVPDEEAKTGKRPADSRIWGGGVYKLWANIKPHFQYREFVNDWDQGGFGIGVIIKPEDKLLSEALISEWKAMSDEQGMQEA